MISMKAKFHWIIYLVVFLTCASLLFEAIGVFCFKSINIFNIVLGVLCLLAGSSLFLSIIKNKIVYFLIFLALALLKCFVINPQNGVPYLYSLGSNTPGFILTVLPISLLLFIRKDGISGWNTMRNKSEMVDAEGEIKRNPSTYMIFITLGLFLALIAGALFVNHVSTPEYASSLKDKVYYALNLPNNEMAQQSLDLAVNASENGLDSRVDYYMDWCEKFKPTSLDVIKDIAFFYFVNQNYKKAAEWYGKALEKDPQDDNLKINLASSFSNFGDYNNAVPLAEQVLENDSNNPIGISVLFDYYINNDPLKGLYWGTRKLMMSQAISEEDNENFGIAISNCLSYSDLSSITDMYIVVSTTESPRLLPAKQYLADVKSGKYVGSSVLHLSRYNDEILSQNEYLLAWISGAEQCVIISDDNILRGPGYSDLSRRWFAAYPDSLLFTLEFIIAGL